MEMVAAADVEGIGEDITPPFSPLSYSLHDSFLFSHCASCFSALPPSPLHSLHGLLYCSPSCSSSHSSVHLSSASHHLHLLLSQNPATPFNGETSDLRVALLLLLRIKRDGSIKGYDRICGLMSNRQKLLMSGDDDELSTRIKKGAKAIAAAIRMRDGCLDSDLLEDEEEYLLEEAVLCVVVSNAVEVQDSVGRSVGIAVYDISFSWINHSCSPNACYRFLPPESHGERQRCLIIPASSNGCEPIEFSTNSSFPAGSWEICSAPRIVVRSIKPIKKGEEITVAYTDLLQPKELRQLDLWSKYRFTCCCSRCVAVPLTHVDQRLQATYAFAINSSSPSSNPWSSNDVEVEKFTQYIDQVIGDYLCFNDAKSCCEKLENALMNGFHYEQHIIKLHPQHHMSINAYTTLASAHKVRAMDENRLYALKMNRFSAAYSFLLPALTHHLYLSESSLIASLANFWTGAGESVLNLAGSLVSSAASELRNCKCSNCSLIDMFEANVGHGQDPCKVLDVSMEFLNCIAEITPKAWRVLVHENSYLEAIQDPIDLRWFETVKPVANKGCELVESKERYKGQANTDLFWLGVHCLLYGGILSNISGGQESYLSCCVRRLLYDGGT